MNYEKLKEAEEKFFMDYPEGFNDPEMIKIGKKHKLGKISEFANEVFAKDKFEDVDQIVEDMIKLVSKSSMVSLFEKPKFRDGVRSFTRDEREILVKAVYELIHGNEELGFNMLLDLLTAYKLAKWTLISVFRCYMYPEYDLLFKPTTVKGIIAKYEIEDLVYKARPSYDFFVRYRDVINEMKKHVDPSLSPNNPSFSGFLMMTM